MARRQVLMFDSRMGLPERWLRSFSSICRIEVWSQTWEFTNPPRLHGDAITSGTRKPSPIGPARLAEPGFDFWRSSSWAMRTHSTEGSMTAETLPVPG